MFETILNRCIALNERIWDFELFAVNWVVVLQIDSVFVVFGLSKVIFVDADGLLVFVQ
jgi:hypothetical protein